MPTWPGDPSKGLLALWGVVRSAVDQRATTADLWSAIRSSGVSASFSQVNSLRGIAAEIRNAASRYAEANPDQAIVGNMISTAPWARSADLQALAPQYQLNVPYSSPEAPPGEISGWVSVRLNALPVTVAELDDLAQAQLDQLDTPEEGATLAGGLQIMGV